MPSSLAFVFSDRGSHRHTIFSKPGIQVLVMTHAQVTRACFSERSSLLALQSEARDRYRLHQGLTFSLLLQILARSFTSQLPGRPGLDAIPFRADKFRHDAGCTIFLSAMDRESQQCKA
jgi:hypothetical protein